MENWQVMMNFIKQYMSDKGISQYDLSQKIGIRQENLNRLLNGKHCPKLDIFLKISDELDLKTSNISRIEKSLKYRADFEQKNKSDITTVWLPYDTSNRSAIIDLNHKILGFNNEGYLIGINLNCMTTYAILPIEEKFESFEEGQEYLKNISIEFLEYLQDTDFIPYGNWSYPITFLEGNKINNFEDFLNKKKRLKFNLKRS